MSYTFITDPVSKNVYSIHSELGRNLIKSYISQVGGDDPDTDSVEGEGASGDLMGDNDALIMKNNEQKKAEEEAERIKQEQQQQVEKNTPAKVEDKSWARFKSQWLIWIGDRFKEMGDLFNSVGNSQNTVEEQSGGNGNEYVKQVLTFIV